MENLNLKSTGNDVISVDYHAELMDNYLLESNIDAGKEIKSLIYTSDNPMAFFIDKEHRLNLIINSNNTSSGWVSYKLSPKEMDVSSFDIHHDSKNNNLRIVYARINQNQSELLVSNKISLNSINPKQFESSLSWKPQIINNSSRIIDHISINGEGVLCSNFYKTTDAKYTYFRYGEATKSFTLPENTGKVLQLEVGKIYNESGVFLLYKMKNANTMLFQSFPDLEYNTVSSYRFSTKKNINAFSLLDNKEGNSALYLAGDGLFKFEDPDSDIEVISESEQNIEYSKILTASNKNEVSIWTIGETDHKKLYYCTNRFYESSTNIKEKWTEPLVLHDYVDEFTCVKGDQFINQLFVFDSTKASSALSHFYQDEISTMWTESEVCLDSLNKLTKKETFTLAIEFNSQNLLHSFHEKKVTISAESNILVYINDKKVHIGPKNSFETLIDVNQINIIYPTQNISPDLLYIEAEFLKEKVTIDPAHKLKEKLKINFNDKNTLRNARKQDGTLLVNSNISDDELEQVSMATNKAFTHLESLSSVENVSSEFIPFVNSGIVSSLGHSVGDIFHTMKKGFTHVSKLIIETVADGVKFIIKIGKEVFTWVAKAASDVFHFLERIWEKVKIFFKDLYDWLAFLLKWKDIIRTKRVMKSYLSNIIEGMGSEVTTLRKQTHTYFDELQYKIKNEKDNISFNELNNINFNDTLVSKKSNIDPRANWLASKKSYLLKGNADEVISALPQKYLTPLIGDLKKLMGYFKELGDKLEVVFSDLLEKFMKIIHGEMKIGDFLQYLVLTLAEIGVSIAQKIIDVLFDLLEGIIKGVNIVLNASIKVPFFSPLYELISGDDLSINDLACLLLAIPTTILYKIGEGVAPFKKEEERKIFLDSATNMFKLTQ